MIDKKDRLFLEGKILTRNYRVFVEYWEDEHRGKSSPKNAQPFEIEKKYIYETPTLIGKDKDNNTYWFSNKDIIIFDKEGWLIENYKTPKNFERTAWPAVHPLGDVYYMTYDMLHTPKYIEICMVSRTWGYNTSKPGKSKSDKVKIQLRPSVKSDVVDELKKDETFDILDKTDIKLKVDKTENYWFKVKKSNGKMGWVYGDDIY